MDYWVNHFTRFTPCHCKYHHSINSSWDCTLQVRNHLLINTFSAIVYSCQNILYALERTSETKVEALCGLLPLIFFYGEVYLAFQTEWAWNYPALVVLLVFPSYCLMTCRHIICSVTKVNLSLFQHI